MKRLVIYPTWWCKNLCPYCTVPLKWRKQESYLPGVSWVNALGLLSPSIIDISGGEPTTYPDIIDLIKFLPKHKFAITSSMNPWEPWEKILAARPEIIYVTLSYQKHLWQSEQEFIDKVNRIKQVYNVSVSVVEPYVNKIYPKDISVVENPYDPPSDKVEDKEEVICNAGMDHIVIGPLGQVWRCWGEAKNNVTPFSDISNIQFAPGWHRCSLPCPNCYKAGQFGVYRNKE